MVLQALYPTKSAVSPVEKPAGGETPTVLLGYKSMNTKDSDGSKSGVKCPTCDDPFDTEKGMKLHHAQAHGESIAGVLVECAWCGKEKRTKRNEAETYDHHFCGAGCKGKWQDENKGMQLSVECEVCSAVVDRQPSKIERAEHHFCSPRCQHEWYRENIEKAGAICEFCGEYFKRRPAHLARREMVVCSQGCRGDWISENWTGVDHPAWMGGHDWDYGPTWPEKREKALERDGRQCVVCGKGERALGREPDVHHIIRKAAFDDLETAHELANLVTLCRGHHIQWEGIPLRPQ